MACNEIQLQLSGGNPLSYADLQGLLVNEGRMKEEEPTTSTETVTDQLNSLLEQKGTAPIRQIEYSHEENALLAHLYLANKEEYHSANTCRSSNGISSQEIFARKWAAELSCLGVAERNSTSVKQRILGLRKYATRMIKRQASDTRKGCLRKKMIPVDDYGQALIDSIRLEMEMKQSNYCESLVQACASAVGTSTLFRDPKQEEVDFDVPFAPDPEPLDSDRQLFLGTDSPLSNYSSPNHGLPRCLQQEDVLKTELVQLELAIAGERLKCVRKKRELLEEKLALVREERQFISEKRRKLDNAPHVTDP